MSETLRPPTPVGGWARPWPDVAELAAAVPADAWTLIGGLMVQLHAVAAGLPIVRPTNDVDVLLHVETSRGRPAEVAAALEQLGYQLRPSIDPRTGTAHRFVRGGAVVDVVAADHAPPRTLERFRGYDLVQVAGGTQALRRTVSAELEIGGAGTTTISVPDAFGALILKAAAHKADARDRDRHLTDAAVLLACVDPFEDRAPSGSDRSRLLHLREHLANPTAPAWLLLPEDARRNGQAALDLLCS
jgi:predicted nucleotidyltransferase